MTEKYLATIERRIGDKLVKINVTSAGAFTAEVKGKTYFDATLTALVDKLTKLSRERRVSIAIPVVIMHGPRETARYQRVTIRGRSERKSEELLVTVNGEKTTWNSYSVEVLGLDGEITDAEIEALNAASERVKAAQSAHFDERKALMDRLKVTRNTVERTGVRPSSFSGHLSIDDLIKQATDAAVAKIAKAEEAATEAGS